MDEIEEIPEVEKLWQKTSIPEINALSVKLADAIMIEEEKYVIDDILYDILLLAFTAGFEAGKNSK